MSRSFQYVAVIVAFFIFSLPTPGVAKKYQRALVIGGGGFQFPIFLGMYESLVRAGYSPDVVVGACGASISVALIHAVSKLEGPKNLTPKQRRLWEIAQLKKLVLSEEFFKFYQRAKVRKFKKEELSNITKLISKLMSESGKRRQGKHPKENEVIPDIFSTTILDVPGRLDVKGLPRLSAYLGKKFEDRGVRGVVVGAKVLFDKKEIGKPRKGKELYQETYFTDPNTAELLKDFKSPIAKFEGSYAAQATVTNNNFTLIDAARVSMADPMYMLPLEHKEGTFMGGSIDLYPVEVGFQLAHHVVILRSGWLSRFEGSVFWHSFGFSLNTRIRYLNQPGVYKNRSVRLVDYNGINPVYKKYGFNPKFNIFAGFQSTFPKTYKEYKAKIEGQWASMDSRVKAAFKNPVRSMEHLSELPKSPPMYP